MRYSLVDGALRIEFESADDAMALIEIISKAIKQPGRLNCIYAIDGETDGAGAIKTIMPHADRGWDFPAAAEDKSMNGPHCTTFAG